MYIPSPHSKNVLAKTLVHMAPTYVCKMKKECKKMRLLLPSGSICKWPFQCISMDVKLLVERDALSRLEVLKLTVLKIFSFLFCI